MFWLRVTLPRSPERGMPLAGLGALFQLALGAIANVVVPPDLIVVQPHCVWCASVQECLVS